MTKSFKLLFLIFSLLGLFSLQATAANRYFKSGATLWNNANSWSATSSAGVDNAGIPGAADIAFFDSGSGNCNVNVNANVLGINSTGYTNTLTQGNFTLTVGASSILWVSGTFVGSASSIITNNITLSGGIFTSTTGTFTVTGSYTFSAGAFNHNNGTVAFVGNGNYTTASIVNGNFYYLTINNSGFEVQYNAPSLVFLLEFLLYFLERDYIELPVQQIPESLLNGTELLALDCQPGHKISILKTELENLQLEGQIKDQASAIEFIKMKFTK